MTGIHPNSMLAYASSMVERASLEQRIMDVMKDGRARTDRQIQNALQHPEPVRPRIHGLVEAGDLHEVGSATCECTGKRVRLTRRFL